MPHGQIDSRVTGSMTENVAPRSGLFAANILPPWRSMMERQIERPIPSPSGLLVMKGSKIDSSLSAANDFASALGDCGDVSHRAEVAALIRASGLR